jgi:hypothetical protein
MSVTETHDRAGNVCGNSRQLEERVSCGWHLSSVILHDCFGEADNRFEAHFGAFANDELRDRSGILDEFRWSRGQLDEACIYRLDLKWAGGLKTHFT